jgi:hypothetical protein
MRKLALSGLALGAAMAVGTAQAEPVTLSANQMDQVTAGGFAFVDGFVNVNIRENVHKTVDIFKVVQKFQFVDVQGYFAEATGGANCSGHGCQALTFAITDVSAKGGFATSLSGSESATSGSFKKVR